jgi:DNA-binding FadR family transcriptional regulator
MTGEASVAAQLARDVMRDAERRGLGPGDYLASEQELIETFHVSRGSVREGLRLLQSMGVVTLRRGTGGGATLAKPRAEQLAGAMAMMLQFGDGDLRTLLEARSVIEPTMAALAARRRSDDQVLRLFESVAELRSDESMATFRRASGRIHAVLASASGNALLAVLVPSLGWMSGALGVTLPLAMRRSVVEGLAGVVKSVEEGDSLRASEYMRATLTASIEELEREAPGLLGQPIVWADVDETLAIYLSDRRSRETHDNGKPSTSGPAVQSGTAGR